MKYLKKNEEKKIRNLLIRYEIILQML